MKPIEVTGLVMSYDGRERAVNDIAFVAEQGKLTTLLGPSGCGKTTTLRCVAGLETPQHGEITMGGTSLFSAARNIDVPAEKRDIGMVFQNYALWPHMSVSENIAFGLTLRGWNRARIAERVREMLDLIRLAGRADASPGQLSGGQQQRVALARALAYAPDVLLLDEPLANLDARLREEMRFELRAIQERTGVTAICVTHDQSEAMVLSDHIIVMRAGHIEQEGPPREIYERPRTEFAARFIGLSNLIELREVEGSDGRYSGRAPMGMVQFRAQGKTVRKLSIRPEDVEIHREPPGDGVNSFPATIASRIFQGESTALFTRSGEQELRVHVGRGVQAATGDTVHLVLPPERLIALED